MSVKMVNCKFPFCEESDAPCRLVPEEECKCMLYIQSERVKRAFIEPIKDYGEQ